MKISISVMYSPARAEQAIALDEMLKTMPFSSIRMITNGPEWDTGKLALLTHDKSDWHIVIQDDAIIDLHFYTNVVKALNAVPERSLVSFYLGKVKPHEGEIKRAFNLAKIHDKSWISCVTLLWGVCIAIPTEEIESVLRYVAKYPRMLYDRRIGQAYQDSKRRVYYTTISLVDHNDDLPSLIGHDTDRKRVAHEFVDGRILEFNDKVQAI